MADFTNNITNNIYGVTSEELQSIVSKDLEISFWDISKIQSGYGHYKITLTFEVDGVEYEQTKTTTDMTLIDEWNGYYANGGISDEDYDYKNPIFSAIEWVFDESEVTGENIYHSA